MSDLRIRQLLVWLGGGLLTTTLAAAGYWLLFTTFMVYDDEGYVLISLRNYSIHGSLYDEVYTQYGPFPYVLYDALSRLFSFTFTNTSGRWITLVNWLTTAAACGALVARTTRSIVWTGITLSGTFVYLWIMINEPIHPGGLVVMVVAISALAAAEAWRFERHVLFGIIIGIAGASLALTKINVGIFFLASACTWLAINAAPAGRARALTWLAALGCAALPLALMSSMLQERWVGVFALVFATGSLSAIMAGRLVATPVATQKSWLAFLITLFVSAAIICAAPLIRGTSLQGLLNGVVLDPLNHPGVYSFPMRWQSGSAMLALASLGFAAFATRPQWAASELFRELIGWLRVVVAVVFWCTSLGVASTSMSRWGLCYGVSLAWLFVLPLQSDKSSGAQRAWVALVLVFQSLQAYPVAGSQLSWGTFLWIPLILLGIHDAVPLLRRRFNGWARTGEKLGYAVLIAMTLVMAGNLARIGWNRYSTSQALSLPGAGDIRVPNDLTYALRVANENLRAHADVLFSFPGMYSSNLWTGLRTPTLANATHWFSLLSAERQQAIIDNLALHPRSAIFVQQELVDYLANHGFPARGPLHTWIMQNFERKLGFGAYEIWTHRDRTVAGLSTARVNRAGNGAVQSLTLTLRSPHADIHSIQLADIDSPHSPFVTLDGPTVTMSVEPCGLDGKPTGAAKPSNFPLVLADIAHVTVPLTDLSAIPGWARPLLILRDVHGEVVAELIMIQ